MAERTRILAILFGWCFAVALAWNAYRFGRYADMAEKAIAGPPRDEEPRTYVVMVPGGAMRGSSGVTSTYLDIGGW